MRKCERPADACANGSGGVKLVHAVGRYRKLALVVMKADAIFSPGQVLVYERELASVKGMEDMRHQKRLRPIKRNRCSGLLLTTPLLKDG